MPSACYRQGRRNNPSWICKPCRSSEETLWRVARVWRLRRLLHATDRNVRWCCFSHCKSESLVEESSACHQTNENRYSSPSVLLEPEAVTAHMQRIGGAHATHILGHKQALIIHSSLISIKHSRAADRDDAHAVHRWRTCDA